ncbi:hypothetical protein GCM10023195_22250 [Actinoallomurus liliacearum]|uniref:Uncharacterized protein n=1 Tax=Actinoallomurus liliacearum TaxID=1080073 RepID=A0ABP8TEJ3_9ACTN
MPTKIATQCHGTVRTMSGFCYTPPGPVSGGFETGPKVYGHEAGTVGGDRRCGGRAGGRRDLGGAARAAERTDDRAAHRGGRRAA